MTFIRGCEKPNKETGRNGWHSVGPASALGKCCFRLIFEVGEGPGRGRERRGGREGMAVSLQIQGFGGAFSRPPSPPPAGLERSSRG
jgi:hypothetical protein